MAEPARRHSPIAGPGLCWRTGPARSRLALRGELRDIAIVAAAALPMAATPCRAVVSGDWAALWLGPDEQLLIGPEAAGPAALATLRGMLLALPHSLVDVSHRQCAIEVAGQHAATLLNTACPLDLDLPQFPVGACTRTVFGKMEIVLWRRGAEQFHLEVWRSFMAYATGLLTQAEAEFAD
jgi:sarcosine oxidase, subunit gamma